MERTNQMGSSQAIEIRRKILEARRRIRFCTGQPSDGFCLALATPAATSRAHDHRAVEFVVRRRLEPAIPEVEHGLAHVEPLRDGTLCVALRETFEPRLAVDVEVVEQI